MYRAWGFNVSLGSTFVLGPTAQYCEHQHKNGKSGATVSGVYPPAKPLTDFRRPPPKRVHIHYLYEVRPQKTILK